MVIYDILFVFDKPIIRIFNQDSDLVKTAAAALPMFSLSFIPMAVNLIYTAFMFSTKRTTQANAIAICRGIVIKSIAIFCIPLIFGSNLIWIAPFVAELFTFALSLVLSKRTPLVYV